MNLPRELSTYCSRGGRSGSIGGVIDRAVARIARRGSLPSLSAAYDGLLPKLVDNAGLDEGEAVADHSSIVATSERVMPEKLEQRHCTPCRGDVPPLGKAAAKRYLVDLPGWQLADDAKRIKRDFRFKNFVEALAFVNDVAAIAEAQGHHPDVGFGWGYASIALQTHKIDGLHENDFILAAKIDAVARADDAGW